jgi:tetratricopeptide (TPR) repeat protein
MRILRQFWMLFAVVVMMGLTQTCRAEDAYVSAARAYRSGEWQAAANGFQAALENSANKDHQQLAAYFLAECLVQLNQPAKAIPHYQGIVEKLPKHRYFRQSLFRLGEAELLAGNPCAAIELLTRFDKQFPRDELRPYALIDLGRAKLAVRDYPAAIDDFKQWIDEFPQGTKLVDVRVALADAYMATARYQEALQSLDQAIKDLPPENPQRLALREQRLLVLGRLGRWEEINTERGAGEVVNITWRGVGAGDLAEVAYAAGNWKDAKELFQELVQHSEDSKQIDRGLSGVAWCQLQKEELPEAAESFAKLLQRAPDDSLAAEASLARGHVLERLQQFDAAIECYRWTAEQSPTEDRRAEGLWRLAKVYHRAERFTEAIQAYQQLAKTQNEEIPADEIAYRLILAYDESGQTGPADAEVIKLRQAFPKSPFLARIVFQIATQLSLRQEFNAAVQLLVDIQPDLVPPDLVGPYFVLLGKLRVLSGNAAAAITDLDRAIRAETVPANQLAAQFWRAEADYQLGNDEDVLRRLPTLLKLAEGVDAPWIAMIPLRKAQSELRLEQYETALVTAKELLQKHPDFTLRYEAELVIGRVLASRGEMVEARAQYQNVIAHAPRSAGNTIALAQWLTGETYFHQEEYQSALSEYAKVQAQRETSHWHAAALLQAGKCSERLGDFTKASEYYEQLIHEYPRSPFAEDAQGRHRLADRMISRHK